MYIPLTCGHTYAYQCRNQWRMTYLEHVEGTVRHTCVTIVHIKNTGDIEGSTRIQIIILQHLLIGAPQYNF